MTDAVAPQGETTPSTTNTEPNAPTSASGGEQAPEAPQMPDLGLSAEQAGQLKNLIDNHGGFDAVFKKWKQDVTSRQKDVPAEPAPAPAPQATTPEPQAPAQPTQPVKLAEGFISQQEINTRRYNRDLSEMPQYAGIKEDILNGNYLKEMINMGMTPMDLAGNLNEKVILQYLDLKAKTVPAPAPEVPMTNVPLRQYTEVEGDITSYEQALAIRKEGSGHPRYADAEQVIKNHFKPSQPEQK